MQYPQVACGSHCQLHLDVFKHRKLFKKCFRKFLQGSVDKSFGDCLVHLLDHEKDSMSLIFTLNFNLMTFGWSIKYSLVLDHVVLDPVERLAGKLRDQEE